MKRKMQIFVPILSVASVILVTSFILELSSYILMPKYMGDSADGRISGEYYKEKDTQHDLLFVGDCEVYESVIPAILWETHGISSYVRGSPGQTVVQSYYLLSDMLKYERPKAVVYSVYALIHNIPYNEAYNRMVLDSMRWSGDKLSAIKNSMTSDESLITYIFPSLRFHSRWSYLAFDDFKYMFAKPQISHSGYLMRKERSEKAKDGTPDELFDYSLPDISFEYLDKMYELCCDNSIELILMKPPVNSPKYYWYGEWSEQVSDYAEKKGIRYFDFTKEKEMMIDPLAESYDGGMHMNVYGAERFSEHLGMILSGEFDIPDRRGEEELSDKWKELVDKYYKERNSE